MKPFKLTVQFPGGSPLIGGASTTPDGFHASHAQLADGRPYVPATALRGALRESLEALLRGTGDHACAGGDGIDPGDGIRDDRVPEREAPEQGAPRPAATAPHAHAAHERADLGPQPLARSDRGCSLGKHGGPCLACRLFGTQRAAIGDPERAFSGLVLGDALPVSAYRWTTRPSVALDRAHRSAKDKHLVLQRVPESVGAGPLESIGARPLSFEARGWVQDPSLERFLEAAARATTHLGAGRSRGLARVDLKIEWELQPQARSALPLGDDGDVQLRVTLRSPALIGASIVDGNYRETRLEIPGSTVRGAVGFALRELVEDPDRDPAMQDLLHEQHGARFGFLYPVDSDARASRGDVSGPLPITAAWCKQETSSHGVVDTLLDRLVLLHARSAVEADRPAESRAGQCPYPGCNQPLRTAHGSRQALDPPKTRTIVRVAMDRTRQSARDGQLFSQVLLAPGVVLTGKIRSIPPHSRHRLAQALGSGIVSFGRGRSAGWGQADIEVEPAPVLPPLPERAAAFDRTLGKRLETARLSSDRIGRLVPVTLLSPLWPSGPDRDLTEPDDDPADDDDGARDLCAALGPATCFLAARRFARDGAWDQRTGKMRTFRATAAGGVFVLELEQATWRDIVSQLEALEHDGVGQRRDQGLGQVLCFDPHFIASQNG